MNLQIYVCTHNSNIYANLQAVVFIFFFFFLFIPSFGVSLFWSSSHKHWFATHSTNSTKTKQERRLINDYKCVYMLIKLVSHFIYIVGVVVVVRVALLLLLPVDLAGSYLFWCCWWFFFCCCCCCCCCSIHFNGQICTYKAHSFATHNVLDSFRLSIGNADIALASKLCQRKTKIYIFPLSFFLFFNSFNI